MKKRIKKNVLLAVAAVVVILALVLMLVLSKRTSTESVELQKGKDFLAQQEQKDPNLVRQARKVLFDRRIEEEKEELMEKLENGEIDPFSLLQDCAVLGDSRAVGFYWWGFLPSDRVLAEAGNTIRAIPDRHEALKELQPSYVFLCYGLNDCGIGFWETGEEYAAEYMEKVRELQELLPECTIVVSSIFRAQDFACEQSTAWYDVPEWNVILEETCKEEGVLFANCDWIYEEHSDLWDSDGVHFMSSLYPYWAGELITTALYGGITNEA